MKFRIHVRTFALRLAGALLLLIIHRLLHGWMADHRTIEVIMSAGSHTPFTELIPALAFVTIRILAVLLLPGFLVYWFCISLAPAQPATLKEAP